MAKEFRKDLVSGDWVLFATERQHSIREHQDPYQPKEGCPFEDPAKSGHEIIWSYPDSGDWKIMVIKNKYPAVTSGVCGPDRQEGPFKLHDGTGDHEVVVFKDHDTHFADFSIEEGMDAIRVYKKRFQEIASEGGPPQRGEARPTKLGGCTEYIMIFHNFGREAGASIYHPHSQIISTPILPSDVSRSIQGSYDFYQKNKKKVYDVVVEWERAEKKRIIFENDFFIAFCPYVSKTPYEVRIFSKDSHAHFEKMPDELDRYLAEALIGVLKKIKKALNNPPYNFFIHTAPIRENKFENFHEFYHWHVEILPKLSISAGFELGTGIDINVVDPDQAAEELKSA